MLEAGRQTDTGSLGQVMEFLVWALLIDQSRGALHVFLPLLDRGLDAVIHRRTDGAYVSVQVKCRTQAINGFVEIGIPARALVDERALIIAGLLTRGELSPKLLVVDEGTFKSVAACSTVNGEKIYSASFSMDSTKSHWRPYLVARDELAHRLLAPTAPFPFAGWPGYLTPEPIDDYSRWLGFLGEQEVIRVLALNADLALFRPFPDLETVEVLVRHNINGRFVGLQVKAAELDPEHYGEARISIRKASFLPAMSTYLVALAFVAEQKRFADECLLVPSECVTEVAVDSGEHLVLNFRPHSQERGRLDPYRQPLSALATLVRDLVA